jgi:hypothetical protein
MEDFWLSDRFQVIAVTDTLAHFNSISNLFMLANHADGEGMTSFSKTQGWKVWLSGRKKRFDRRNPHRSSI